MSHKVRYYGDHATFPAGACVHCLRPAAQQLELTRVKQRLSGGYVARKVRVPFCQACLALRQAKTPRQVRFERAAVVNSLLLALVVGVYLFFTAASLQVGPWALGENGPWRALLGLLSAQVVFGLLYRLSRAWARSFQSADTRAALRAVSIADFDWETTTLEFADGEYAERFTQANQGNPLG